jgi:23S rRNA (uracil1939-C5)-methyltransferase
MPLNNGDIIEVEIDNLAYGGRGIARVNNFVVFVPSTVPGDLARVKVTKKKSNHAIGELVQLTNPSKFRVVPPCPLFDVCGGCTWQNITYQAQLTFKQQILLSTLEHLGNVEDIDIRPILPSPEIWHYRNKMDFTFGSDRAHPVKIGFHKADDFAEVIDVKRCLIHPVVFDRVLEIVREFALKQRVTCYDPRTHEGTLRHVIVRAARRSAEMLVVLLTHDEAVRNVDSLAHTIRGEIPAVKAFVWGINRGLGDVAVMEREMLRHGEAFITEQLDGLQFRISPFSFFQTNTAGAEQLYRVVRDVSELSGKENLFDAYCGTGAIGIFCAERARKVYGVESLVEAVWDARANAALNRRDNCLFLAGEMRKALPLLLSFVTEDIRRVVVDPPRSGMDKKSLRHIIELNAPILIYVSCNPTTLARDCVPLRESGYRLQSVHPVDMFPHTYHIEAVAKFVKM